MESMQYHRFCTETAPEISIGKATLGILGGNHLLISKLQFVSYELKRYTKADVR
jgi:hypothetical protein